MSDRNPVTDDCRLGVFDRIGNPDIPHGSLDLGRDPPVLVCPFCNNRYVVVVPIVDRRAPTASEPQP